MAYRFTAGLVRGTERLCQSLRKAGRKDAQTVASHCLRKTDKIAAGNSDGVTCEFLTFFLLFWQLGQLRAPVFSFRAHVPFRVFGLPDAYDIPVELLLMPYVPLKYAFPALKTWKLLSFKMRES